MIWGSFYQAVSLGLQSGEINHRAIVRDLWRRWCGWGLDMMMTRVNNGNSQHMGL